MPHAPAATCPQCYRTGTLADSQILGDRGNTQRAKTLRFECHHCHAAWTTDREQALAHGRFLARMNQTRPL